MIFNTVPRWFKQTIAITGLLLALPGFFIGFGLLCLTLILVINNDSGAIYAGLIGFTLIVLTTGTGGTTFWHTIASLKGKKSNPMRLPPLWGLIGIFALCFAIGLMIYQGNIVTGLFLPPILLLIVPIPSLMATIWFANRQSDGLAWRRGIIAFAGAATVSLIIFIVLQFVILVITSMLSPNPGKAMVDTLELVFDGRVRQNTFSLYDQHFTYIFIQISIIIPIIGTLAKSLITVPLLGQLSRRETFLLGAIAGAGFATMESILFIAYGLQVWFWILIVQALGGAIHPLGSGLVALGLREMVRGKPNAWSNWLGFSGIATTLHALWNLGVLLILSRNSLFFIDGSSASAIQWRAITTILILITLAGLGLGTPWAGHSIGQKLNKVSGISNAETIVNRPNLLDRDIAIWTLTGLVVILPVGIIGLQILVK